ncbi:hypothetical protein Droror1_Dr00008720 [Drosera rotundifolia]
MSSSSPTPLAAPSFLPFNPNQGSEMAGMQRKRSRGRCKIRIAKIQDKSKRHVAFSKRRRGLFKKASELRALTGTCRIAAITFSEAGKAFAFGHSSADLVIDRYLRSSCSSSTSSSGVSPSLSSSTSDGGRCSGLCYVEGDYLKDCYVAADSVGDLGLFDDDGCGFGRLYPSS